MTKIAHGTVMLDHSARIYDHSSPYACSGVNYRRGQDRATGAESIRKTAIWISDQMRAYQPQFLRMGLKHTAGSGVAHSHDYAMTIYTNQVRSSDWDAVNKRSHRAHLVSKDHFCRPYSLCYGANHSAVAACPK